jgi:hypothetical protein
VMSVAVAAPLDLPKLATRKAKAPKAMEAMALPTRLKKAASRKAPAKKGAAASVVVENLAEGGEVVASPTDAIGA